MIKDDNQWCCWCDSRPNSNARMCPHTAEGMVPVRLGLPSFLACLLKSRWGRHLLIRPLHPSWQIFSCCSLLQVLSSYTVAKGTMQVWMVELIGGIFAAFGLPPLDVSLPVQFRAEQLFGRHSPASRIWLPDNLSCTLHPWTNSIPFDQATRSNHTPSLTQLQRPVLQQQGAGWSSQTLYLI